jgi:hypothetical protein
MTMMLMLAKKEMMTPMILTPDSQVEDLNTVWLQHCDNGEETHNYSTKLVLFFS